MHMIRTIVATVGILGFTLGGTSAGAATVTVHRAPGTIELAGVGCETASTCIAVGAGPTVPTDGTVVTVTNGVPGPATAVAATGSLLAVTCWSATRCVAVGPSHGPAPEAEQAPPSGAITIPPLRTMARVTLASVNTEKSVPRTPNAATGVFIR